MLDHQSLLSQYFASRITAAQLLMRLGGVVIKGPTQTLEKLQQCGREYFNFFLIPASQMTLDPQAKVLLDTFATLPPIDYSTLTAQACRADHDARRPIAPGDSVPHVEERDIPGPVGPMRIRIYRPELTGPFPITVFVHGGGFVVCSLDWYDNICRCLCNRAKTIVVSVDYRLAPEAKFPAAVDDVCVAVRWVHENASDLGGIASLIAVAGDSAGGNLAAVAAQQTRTEGLSLCHQLLLYPVTDCRFDTKSYRSFGQGYMVSEEMMRWFWSQYLPDMSSAVDVRASPLRQKDLSGLPSATVITAEYDPLRDEAEAYAAALQAAGVPTDLYRWPGQLHGFMSLISVIDAADIALTTAALALQRAFDAAQR